VAALETPGERLEVGGTGKVGLLELSFALEDGVTRLVRHFQQVPLQIFRPLHVDPGRPGMAVVYVAQTGGGILQGDRYRLDVVCRPRAEVHLTTQAATKIYRMDGNYATQLVNLTAEDGAILEYLPDPVIPFGGSRFYQQLRLTVAPTATVIACEVLLPGRVAHGERHAYGLFSSRTECRAPDGTLLFADTVTLRPAIAPPNSPGRLGPYDVLGTLYLVSRLADPRALAVRVHDLLSESEGILGGASELPSGCGLTVRILGHTSAAVQEALRAAWNEARLALLEAPAPDLRKG
jgi:urease accessory protein